MERVKKLAHRKAAAIARRTAGKPGWQAEAGRGVVRWGG